MAVAGFVIAVSTFYSDTIRNLEKCVTINTRLFPVSLYPIIERSINWEFGKASKAAYCVTVTDVTVNDRGLYQFPPLK